MALPSCLLVISVMFTLSVKGSDVITPPQPCCSKIGDIFDINSQKCVPNELLAKFNGETLNGSDPIFICSDGWESLKIVDFSQPLPILQSNQYCIQSGEEKNETTIAFCRPSALMTTIQLKKCCPTGQSVNRHSIGECVANDRQLFNASKIIPKGFSYKIVDNFSLVCDYGYNIYVPKMFVDNFYIVNPSNELVVPRSMYKILGQSSDYCVDNYLNQNGQEEDIAMICLPWRMHILRYLLRVVYPHLHFISALFLLLTMMVYLVFPTLRDNIQGYSMICFLICMIIVQIEYGVLLALPYEPHTWCFFKTQASNFFRYASSTWITVMGFNIWFTLSRGSKPQNKTQLFIRFGLLSIYAWGVPLALQMAVIIYRNSLGPPVELCWFGNPVMKSLLSTPNVILVTANLIFFIPSALKVYGSLRFLKTSVSPVALNKLEKQRITTIFRFFLLMQFYTIPRIVHEIVDSDNASPELLMFSVSLYTLIGPAMFYFFVCKVEVYKLIKNLSNGIRESSSTRLSKLSVSSMKVAWRFQSKSYQTSNEMPNTAVNTSTSVHSIRYKTKGEENPSFVHDTPQPTV